MAKKKKQDEQTYWQLRNIKAEKRINDGAKALEDKLIIAYRQAQYYLTKQTRKLFDRSKKRTGLDEKEARKLLNETVSPSELVKLKVLSEQISNTTLQKEAKKKLTSLAFKKRITKAEDLKAKSFLVSPIVKLS